MYWTDIVYVLERINVIFRINLVFVEDKHVQNLNIC